MTPKETDRPSGDGGRRRPVSSARLSALHVTFEELREQRRALLADLRALLAETHSQSDRLRKKWDQPDAAAAPSPLARLQSHYGLTPREAEVALLIAEGLSNSAVAKRLRISPHTARHHTQHVLGKLGVHSRSEAGARLRR